MEERSEDDLHFLNSLLNRDNLGPEEFYNTPGKDQFFKVLKNPNSGLAITNLCEHMLLKGKDVDRKHSSFWFVVGLKYHEKYETELLARHLTLLAIFYHAQERTMIAEGLLTRALELTKDKNDIHEAFTNKIFSFILSTKPTRTSEAEKHRLLSQEIESNLKPWSAKIAQFLIPTHHH